MAYNFLIVDDSSTARTIIKKIIGLSKVGVGGIYEAENGQEGLKILDKEWIDLVFADINMPVMSGHEMIKIMSKHGLLKKMPVVIVSSDGSEIMVEEMMAAGVKAYLRKPFTPETIKKILYEILGGSNE